MVWVVAHSFTHWFTHSLICSLFIWERFPKYHCAQEFTNTMGTARAGGCARCCISYPSRPPVEEREMVEGFPGRLETNPASKDKARKGCLCCLLEGTQPEVRVLHSQPGCWGAGVLWSTAYINSPRPLAIQFVKRVKWSIPTVRCLAVVSVCRTFCMFLSLSKGQREEASWNSTRNSDHREQYRMLLHGDLHEPPVAGYECTSAQWAASLGGTAGTAIQVPPLPLLWSILPF